MKFAEFYNQFRQINQTQLIQIPHQNTSDQTPKPQNAITQSRSNKKDITIKSDPLIIKSLIFQHYIIKLREGQPPISNSYSFQFTYPLYSKDYNFGEAISFFEVTIIECGNKKGAFSVGLTTPEFIFMKQIGIDPLDCNSIGLNGDGKLMMKGTQLRLNSSAKFEFKEEQIIGVGYIHYSHKIFFTVKNTIIYEQPLPSHLKAKTLFASMSIGSREDEFEVNFGSRPFFFDIESKVQTHFHEIYSQIQQFQKCSEGIVKHLIYEHLDHNGFEKTLKGIQKDQEFNMKESDWFEITQDEQLIQQGDNRKRFKSMKDNNMIDQIERNERLDSILSQQEGFQVKERSESMAVIQQSQKSVQQNQYVMSNDLPIRKKLRKLICKKKIKDSIDLILSNYPNLFKKNKQIKCSLLSIEIVDLIQNQDIENILKLIEEYKLNEDQNVEVVSVDENLLPVKFKFKEIMNLICHNGDIPSDVKYPKFGKRKQKIFDKPYLYFETHVEAVADFINQEIILELAEQTQNKQRKRDSKLERIMKHTVGLLNIYDNKSRKQ